MVQVGALSDRRTAVRPLECCTLEARFESQSTPDFALRMRSVIAEVNECAKKKKILEPPLGRLPDDTDSAGVEKKEKKVCVRVILLCTMAVLWRSGYCRG